MGALVFVLTLVLSIVLSYGVTAEWWSWQMALGIWLVLVFMKTAFGRSDK